MISITGYGQRRRTWWRMGLVATILTVAAPLAAACSGGPHPGPRASPPPGRAQRLDVFARCLRNNGEPNAYISPPDSNSNSSAQVLSIMGYTLTGVTPGTTQFTSAMKACKHLLPGGGGPPALTQQQRTQMLRFAACMRAHGYPAYPDPQFQGRGVIEQPLPASIDTTSPQYEAALKACGTSP